MQPKLICSELWLQGADLPAPLLCEASEQNRREKRMRGEEEEKDVARKSSHIFPQPLSRPESPSHPLSLRLPSRSALIIPSLPRVRDPGAAAPIVVGFILLHFLLPCSASFTCFLQYAAPQRLSVWNFASRV